LLVRDRLGVGTTAIGFVGNGQLPTRFCLFLGLGASLMTLRTNGTSPSFALLYQQVSADIDWQLFEGPI
jgi:hypothetical protein